MEFDLIQRLRKMLPAHPDVPVGPGDDAAVLRWADLNADCVVTTDLLSDHVDFELSQVDPERVGRKALAVNLSDLAAMAAVPVAAVISLVLPRSGGTELARRFYDGLVPLAREFNTAIAGGDTNAWDGPFAVSITAIGKTTRHGSLRRNGARAGDVICVTGAFGGSILGHQFDFTPRVSEALLLNEKYELHAGIDCSDGLAADLAHICRESGCGAIVDATAVPIAEAAHEMANQEGDTRSPLQHAFGDGEDFELILAVPPEVASRLVAHNPLEIPITPIGHFSSENTLLLKQLDGKTTPLEIRGWEHDF